MNRIGATARLISIAVAVTVAAQISAQTGTWSSPAVLSTGGEGWEAAAAIDGNGNSLALWDERLSTAAVTRTLLEADASRKRRAEVVDKMAAAYILQGALDALAHNR